MNVSGHDPKGRLAPPATDKEGFWGTLSGYYLDGIDFSLDGNGGPNCAASLPMARRVLEDLVAVALCLGSLAFGLRRHRPPPRRSQLKHVLTNDYSPGRVALLVAMTAAYALELGYKMATRQMVFLNQPCHQLCLVHIALLAWPASSSWLTYVFRVHLYFLHGPIMAILFPVTNTLFLPGEVLVYWLEHIVLLTVPFYLLRHGGIFTVEGFTYEYTQGLLYTFI